MNTVNNVNSQNFKGICIQKSMMNGLQNFNASRIADATISAIKYDEILKKGADIFILAGKTDNSLRIRAIDRFSGEYLRTLTNKIAEIKLSARENVYTASDKILDFFSKDLKTPQINSQRIFEGKTPLLKANPELHEEVLDGYNTYIKCMNKKDAINMAVFDFCNLPSKIKEQGYNFDF